MTFETRSTTSGAWETLVLVPWGGRPSVQEGNPEVLEEGPVDQPFPARDERISVRWDPAQRTTLARPARFGARPLFFRAARDGVILSGSALRLARDLAPSIRGIDRKAALAQLGGEAIDSPATVFRGVYRVGPGSCLAVAPGRNRWALRPAVPDEARASASDRTLEEALPDAVRRCLDPDGVVVPLSGGLDSSLLLALAVAERASVRAATLDDGEEAGAWRSAADLAEAAGVRIERVPVSLGEMVAGFPAAVRACEGLVWNARAVAKFAFYSGLAGAMPRRVLSGVGADELFWGNPAAWDPRAGKGPMVERIAGDRAWAGRLGRGEAPGVLCLDGALARGVRDATRRLLLAYSLPWSTLPPECGSADRLGIDVRLPYLDDEVARHALGLPWRRLVRGNLGKVPLRSFARGRVPRDIAGGRKTPILAAAAGPGSERRRRWTAEYERWVRAPGLAEATGWDTTELDAWLKKFARVRADDPELPRLDRMLMRVASLSILREAVEAPG